MDSQTSHEKKIYGEHRENMLTSSVFAYKKEFCALKPIPRAALNILASGFSYPTSEDTITASNLHQDQKKSF